jgi:hypothetical protein
MKLKYSKLNNALKIKENYEKMKSSHLEKLGTLILKNEEKFQKLKNKKINNNFLKHF